MSAWIPVFFLPNLDVKEPVEAGEIALVGCDDPRVIEIADTYPRFGEMLSKFTDSFGTQLRPSVVLVRDESQKWIWNVEALASFRNAVALSVIPYQRAKMLLHPPSFAPLYFEWFEFYPWAIDKNYADLTCNTPAMWGVHLLEEFKGQSTPGLSVTDLDARDYDKPLLAELLVRWRRRYRATKPKWRDIALFRSLNMAASACKMPGGRDVTIFDLGRTLSLWVSAFEILVHPGSGKSHFKLVYDLLAQTPWVQRQCRDRRYRAHISRDPKEQRRAPFRNLACWIYGEINHARNDFMHGNPIDRSRLTVKRSNRNLFWYAAPLYRMALTGFLKLEFAAARPNAADKDATIDYERNHFDYYDSQREIESALRSILVRRKTNVGQPPGATGRRRVSATN